MVVKVQALEADLETGQPEAGPATAEVRAAYVKWPQVAASDRKAGAVDNGVAFFDQPSCHHKPEVYGGIQEQAAARLLKDFFALRRNEPFF